MTEVNIYSERVDDIPLLMHLQGQMGIPAVLNEAISGPGNRAGLSLGSWLTTWLCFLLSEADHRLCQVEPWAATKIETLQALLPEEVRVKDFTDDRLADALRLLSDDQTWELIEAQLGRRLVRVYHLDSDLVRLDSTTAAIYHETEGTTLFRHGHSKDHRPDLAQFKVRLGSLDPLGMPVARLVVSGAQADDPLYLPALERSRQVGGQGGKLYVGDSNLSALHIRAALAQSGDYYRSPLAGTGQRPAWLRELLAPVVNRQQALASITSPASEGPDGEAKLLALGYELTRPQQQVVDGKVMAWEERVLVIYSPSLAAQQRRGLQHRLEKAEQELSQLIPPRGRGHRQWEEVAGLEAEVAAMLKQYRVDGLLEVSYQQEVATRTVRRYGERPARTTTQGRWVVQVRRNREAINQVRLELGWRLYVTNAPTERLFLPQAVWAYRGAPRMERNFRRLKGRPLGLRPVFVKREDHATGLARLLSLALRVLTVAEFVVREKLRATSATVKGIYAGNPQRATTQPTRERLLQAFAEITLRVVSLPDRVIRHLTPLTEVQQQILLLLGLSASIYEGIVSELQPIPP